MKLTVGMATHQDFHGTWPTVMALRMYHPEVFDVPGFAEVVVVDNAPDTEDGTMNRDFMNWIKPEQRQYVRAPEVQGTSAPRQKVFEVARGEIVVCIDSHVMLHPGSLKRLVDYADAHPDSRDLWQGPMMYDNLESMSTHFDPVWRSEMLGTWGTDERAKDIDAEPFEIPAQGLGMFACRKDAWLGFNPALRGFGGEEVCLHEKFRQAGHKTLCMPFLRWAHRFGRPGGPKYRLTLWDKARNYVIWHRELGWSLDPVYDHFVKQGHLPQSEWDALMEGRDLMQEMHGIKDGAVWKAPPVVPPLAAKTDFAKFADEKPPTGCKTCGGGAKPADVPVEPLDVLFERASKTVSDINEHAVTLKELASQCEHVTEFGMRHGVSTVALLAGQPGTFVTYDLNRPNEADSLAKVAGKTNFKFVQGSSIEVDIEETDLLFIDTKHTADHLWAELSRHAGKVRRWIALHDTMVYGERGEDGTAGLLPAMRRFIHENREWSVIRHDVNNNGFTVLSKDPKDKPELPGFIEMGVNLAKAVAAHVADGLKNVEQDEYKARLEICTICPQLKPGTEQEKDRCAACGCFLAEKALWRASVCPLGKWSKSEPPAEKPAELAEVAS